MDVRLLSVDKSENILGRIENLSVKTDSENKKDIFEDFIAKFLNTTKDENSKNIFISKLLNISTNNNNNDDIKNFLQEIKNYSKHKKNTLNNDKNDEIDILENLTQDLIQLSLMLKKGNDLKDFKTDSKELKELLNEKNFQQELKSAKNIEDLIQIAKKNGIQIKKITIEKIGVNQHRVNIKSDSFAKLINSKSVDKSLEKIPRDKDSVIKDILAKVSNLKKENKEVESQEQKLKLQKVNTLHDFKKKNNENQNIEDILKIEKNSKDKEIKGVAKQDIKEKNDKNEKIKVLQVEEKEVIKNKDITNKEIEVKREVNLSVDKDKKYAIKQENNKNDDIKVEKVGGQQVSKNGDIVNKGIEIKKEVKIIDRDKKDVSNLNRIKKKDIQQKKSVKNVKNDEIKVAKVDEQQFSKNEVNEVNIEKKDKKDVSKEKNLIKNINDSLDRKVDVNIKKTIQKEGRVDELSNRQIQEPIQQRYISQSIKIKDKNKNNIEELFSLQKQDIERFDKKIENNLQKIISKNEKMNKENITTNSQQNLNNIELADNESVRESDNHESHKEQAKVEHINFHKIDSVKYNHESKVVAKTLNTFAQEFKEKVESYKAPLMKIKMQLKPIGLGEVDVTMINRGKNLHISVNSNPNIIAIFSQNQVEFKNSLINMGFHELSMSFNENGKNRDEQNQKQRKIKSENLDTLHEEDSFEMITPLYI